MCACVKKWQLIYHIYSIYNNELLYDTCLKTIQQPEAGRELKVHTKNQAIELRTFVINNDLNIGLLTKTKTGLIDVLD